MDRFGARLSVAAVLLLPLWLAMSELSFFSTVGREVLWTLAEGLFAVSIVVLLVPVLIRGDWVQLLLALVVLPLPVLALWDAFSRMS